MKKRVHHIPLTLGGAVLALLFLVSTMYLPVGAQQTTPDPIKETDEKVRLFFADVLDGKESKAFDDLLFASSTSEQLADIKKKLEDAKTQFGAFRKSEKIGEKIVGEDLVFVRYLLKCDRHPIVWTFTFYRRPTGTSSLSTTSNQWSVVGLRFDANLDPLF